MFNVHKYILKQWITLITRSEWLLKLRISFVLRLQAKHAEFTPENMVIVARINEPKSPQWIV